MFKRVMGAASLPIPPPLWEGAQVEIPPGGGGNISKIPGGPEKYLLKLKVGCKNRQKKVQKVRFRA